jgi:hypothetical protein
LPGGAGSAERWDRQEVGARQCGLNGTAPTGVRGARGRCRVPTAVRDASGTAEAVPYTSAVGAARGRVTMPDLPGTTDRSGETSGRQMTRTQKARKAAAARQRKQQIPSRDTLRDANTARRPRGGLCRDDNGAQRAAPLRKANARMRRGRRSRKAARSEEAGAAATKATSGRSEQRPYGRQLQGKRGCAGCGGDGPAATNPGGGTACRAPTEGECNPRKK